MSDFVWSFPCYVMIGANENGLAFAAPDGDLAVFTDIDLALTYCKMIHPTFSPVALGTRAIAFGFLRFVSKQFTHVRIDPNPDPQRYSFRMPLGNALESLRLE